MKATPTESISFISSRRSVFPKEFEEGKLSKAEVRQLLEPAQWAPTHKVTEPWRFHVFMDDAIDALVAAQTKALRAKLGETEAGDMKVAKIQSLGEKASAIVAVVMERDPQDTTEQMRTKLCLLPSIIKHPNRPTKEHRRPQRSRG